MSSRPTRGNRTVSKCGHCARLKSGVTRFDPETVQRRCAGNGIQTRLKTGERARSSRVIGIQAAFGTVVPFIDIAAYMQLPRATRRAHLRARRSEVIIAAGYPDYGWITRAAERLHLSHTHRSDVLCADTQKVNFA